MVLVRNLVANMSQELVVDILYLVLCLLDEVERFFLADAVLELLVDFVVFVS